MNRAIAFLLALSAAAPLAIAANAPPVIKTQIANQTLFAGVTSKIDLTNAFNDPDTNAVRFSTVQGNFDVQLFTAQKPITVANFLKYVDQGRYFKIDPTTHHRASSFVHRMIPNFVVQGGGLYRNSRHIRSDNRHSDAAGDISSDPERAGHFKQTRHNRNGEIGR